LFLTASFNPDAAIKQERKIEVPKLLESLPKNISNEDQAYLKKYGEKLSDSTQYAQWIGGPDDHEDHSGQSLVTRNHDVIKAWANCFSAEALVGNSALRLVDLAVLRKAMETSNGRFSDKSLANSLSSILLQRSLDKWDDRTSDQFRTALREARDRVEAAALDTELMVEHVKALRAGREVDIPTYDFARYARRTATEHVEPRDAIIVEGILIYTDAALRELMDVKIFVDTDADTRFIRRLRRDVAERGRTMDSVIEQYLGTVKPMHLEFVEPSKRYADVIVPQGGHNAVAIDMLLTLIQSLAKA
jgi:uridine kinase